MDEYYKKIDKSFFKYGLTIPNDYVYIFLKGIPIDLGKSRDVIIRFKEIDYDCKLNHVNRKKANSVYQLRWDTNSDLLSELKKEFIQTYFAIESQNYTAKKQDKYYVTKLMGGNQEVTIFKPVDGIIILLETYIKIETPYDNIFKEMVDQNIFGWMSKEKQSQIITKSSRWINKEELYKYEEICYVVYYLIDDEKKEIYIGSAKRLGDRVKPDRKEIPGWNKFRYEIIHPLFHEHLRATPHNSKYADAIPG